MICDFCRGGADSKNLDLHNFCRGGNWCDCQHRNVQAVNK